MNPQKPSQRFLIGLAAALVVIIALGIWVTALVPSWGAQADEITRVLPGDEAVPKPDMLWNHVITIHATPEQIYPWLAQLGDSRGGFYSFTFIENLFQRTGNASYWYINANAIHPEWQTPAPEQGIIMEYMAITQTQANQYVLAQATDKLPMKWTWIWYLQPVDAQNTRLIVRHRIQFPADAPAGVMTAVFNGGYIMERGMMLGIRNRAEGAPTGDWEEYLGAFLWFSALICGLIAAVRFIRQPYFHPLGVGIEAIAALFLFTYVQPDYWLRALIVVVLVVGVVIAYRPWAKQAPVNQKAMPAKAISGK